MLKHCVRWRQFVFAHLIHSAATSAAVATLVGKTRFCTSRVFQNGASVGKTTRTFEKLCLCSSSLPLSFPGKRQGRTTLSSGKCKKLFLFVQRKTHPTHNKQLASCTTTKTSVRNTGKHQKNR